jgi:DNA-binding NarL/FixJ family response regulator
MSEPPAPARHGQQPIPVMLVDDHKIWRDGLRSVLEATEFVVVGEAATFEETMEVAARTAPRIILLDVRLAGADGLDLLAKLKQAHPRVAVLMLSTYDDPAFMARAIRDGAAGYLMKGVDVEDLLGALRAVASREAQLAPRELADSLRQVVKRADPAADLVEPLTEREIEVLKLLAKGLSNREIAQALFIADSTAKTHVEHIIGKLGVSDRVQAAVWAVQHDLVAVEP